MKFDVPLVVIKGDRELMTFREFDDTPVEGWADLRPTDDSMYMNHCCDPTCTDVRVLV